jgi:acetolactate synthase small subunit
MQLTLIALVENKPGVLNRVASLFRRRNFNISLKTALWMRAKLKPTCTNWST